jgi:hypothetical protein
MTIEEKRKKNSSRLLQAFRRPSQYIYLRGHYHEIYIKFKKFSGRFLWFWRFAEFQLLLKLKVILFQRTKMCSTLERACKKHRFPNFFIPSSRIPLSINRYDNQTLLCYLRIYSSEGVPPSSHIKWIPACQCAHFPYYKNTRFILFQRRKGK